MNNRGSEWCKWDLHIHSNASDGGDCAEIISVAKAQGLSAIAITDHHTAKNIDSARQLALVQGIKVIPGIEFRSEYGSSSVHFIGLFPDKHKNIEINAKSLTELILNPLGLSETIIVAKGREKDASYSEAKAFKIGMFLVQVDFKKASELIHKYGGLVVVHAGTKGNSLDEEMKHQGKGERNTKELYDSLGTVKEELLKGYIDICEIRKEGDSDAFYRDTFGLPSILASDAHKASEVGSKFTWIKANPTFDGLRQIIYEPKERVSLSDSKPDRKNDYLVIDRIEICHTDFSNQTISLNQNLNSIIGGRSSGKSILLGALAKSIGSEREVKKGKLDYNKYIEEQIVPNLNVYWCDGSPNTGRKIDYFPQSFINSLAADSTEIANLIEGIIRNDPVRKLLLDEFQRKTILLRTELNNLISEYFQGTEIIKGIKDNLLTLGVKSGILRQIEALETELASVKDKMATPLDKSEESQYTEQSLTINRIKKVITEIDDDKAVLLTLDPIITFPDISTRFISLTNDNKQRLQDHYGQISQTFLSQWSQFVSDTINSGIERKESCLAEILKTENDPIYIKCSKYFNENRAYVEIEVKLKGEREIYESISTKELELKNLLNSQDLKRIQILDKYKQYYSLPASIANELSYSKDDVKIICNVSFSAARFKQILGDRFNQRAYEVQAIVNYEYHDQPHFQDHMSMIMNKMLSEGIPLRANTTKQQAIIDVFTSSFFEISYDVLYENDSLSQMSEGKKAFIILRMLLEFSENGYPILIDQPEDDLDNRAIYDEMATYLKAIKKKRQVIVVSHNPNIVVGSDSELVICANQHGIGNKNQNEVKFEYLSGSLELTSPKIAAVTVLASQGIKEHVCDILEGGNEAFLQRERKYRIAK